MVESSQYDRETMYLKRAFRRVGEWAPNLTERVMPSRAQDGLQRFFGVPLRLAAAIVAAGLAGGALGAAYIRTLDVIDTWLGPDRWSVAAHGVMLVGVGLVVAVGIGLLGRPADVELVIDNIHIPEPQERGSESRVRSLLPISLLCIGAGGPLGPEAPVVTMTGTVAHRLGRLFQLQVPEVRIVTIAGMAAGFTVLFNAPLGAALFALEIPHRRGIQYYEAIIPAAIGAVIGFGISTAVIRSGLQPVWDFPAIAPLHWPDLLWSVVAGALGAAIAVTFTLVTTGLKHVFRRIPMVARPAVGGGVLAMLAFVTPNALTNGEHQLNTLTGKVLVATLLVAGAVKLVAASVGVATGWRGGFIIPLFFVGFCFSKACAGLLPGASEWAFIAATMVAANVGVTKTPLGSTLAVTGMAGIRLLPSTLIAALTSLILTSSLGLIDAQRERVDVYAANGHG